MIRLVQRKLIIPRGDTGTFSVPVISTLNTGDVAVFTIIDMKTKRKVYEKIIDATPDTISIRFEHSDTVNLPVGRYYWDIKFYQNPEWVDNELINGTEVDSYYAAYSLPECEIRLTGDNLLTADDSPTTTITPYYLNVLNATVNDVNHAKTEITELANSANEAATRAQEQADSIKQLSATVTMLGTNDEPTSVYNSETGVLALGIPAPNSIFGILKTSEDGLVDTYTISYTNGTSTTFTVTNGMIPNLTIGTVQEGATAAASITGTTANPILNLTLPNANVPTRVSQLENDAGYLTEHQDLSDYVQRTDYATSSDAGVVKIDSSYGIQISSNGYLQTSAPSDSQIKSANKTAGTYRPIVPSVQHISTFYGLAKAAGDTTQSQSSNAVGTYTDEAKSAIQTMLDVPSNADIPTQVSDLTNDAGYITTETDPTVPAWAKAAKKPTYTALEVGAVDRTGDLMTGTLHVRSGDNMVIIGRSAQMSQGSGAFISSNAIAFQWESSSGNTYRNVEIKRATPTKLQLSQNYTSGKNVVVSGVDTPVDNTDAANKGYVDEAIAQIKGMNIHICAQGEYNAETGVPTIQNPDTQTFYLVPGGEGNNLFIEWAYVNGAWERFGSADVEVPVTDVQVNGVSVLSNGVANVPRATSSSLGVVIADGTYGIEPYGIMGRIQISRATDSQIKNGTVAVKPIVASNQHQAAFYGLAKAAGADMKDIANTTIGIYPDAQKEAIQSMLGITQMLAPTNPNLVASQPYAIGDVFAANGHLYKATAAIAQDEAIIPDTNCVETTMAEAGGKIKDVQVAGTSVVENGVANVPLATNNSVGVVKAGTGISINLSGQLYNTTPTDNAIKLGAAPYNAVTLSKQHVSIFYGLSKAAGVDLKDETVTLGTYPETSKIAIKAMLGVQDGLKVVRLI